MPIIRQDETSHKQKLVESLRKFNVSLLQLIGDHDERNVNCIEYQVPIIMQVESIKFIVCFSFYDVNK